MSSAFGGLLKQGREFRHVSQLELSNSSGVSQRHVSFLETGKSTPSKEMVIHLATALNVPLRSRNDWLTAAGHAPIYVERSLSEPALDQIRETFEQVLAAHNPFPAYVVDRGWTIQLANAAALNLIMQLIDPDDAELLATNAVRLTLHPRGIRKHTTNWEQLAAFLLHRLQREAAERPGDATLQALLHEILDYPDVAELPQRPEIPTSHDLFVPANITLNGIDLQLFTTIATIGAAFDITLEELRLETLLPANPETMAALKVLAKG